MTSLLRNRVLVGSSRRALTRGYAAAPSQNPNLVVQSDSRSDLLRSVLYPPNSYAPNSSSPVGAHHPDHIERLKAVVPSSEAWETIERAYQLFRRQERDARKRTLEAKFNSMVDACNELDEITNPENGGVESDSGKGGKYHRQVYEWAMAQINQAERRGEQPKGKKTVEQRWLETRIEGLVPREMWIPTETRGKGWDYNWTRPGV